MDNVNVAPFPHDLADLVAECKYRPGWRIRLVEDLDRGQGSRGLTLVVTTDTVDTYHPENRIHVNHYFPVPPAAYDRRSWQRWFFDQLGLVDDHERMEFFQIGEDRPYAPSHGPGNDPYIVREYGEDVDRRTDFRGRVHPA